MRSWKYVIFFNSLLFLIQIQFVRSQLTTNGLGLNLDASNPSSYSGIGSTWNDTSGNNKDFNINTATYNNGGYFVFDGNDGMTWSPKAKPISKPVKSLELQGKVLGMTICIQCH